MVAIWRFMANFKAAAWVGVPRSKVREDKEVRTFRAWSLASGVPPKKKMT